MNKKIELIERCKALGLQSGSLFDWLEMIESLTAQRDALAQENKRLVEALEFARDKISELHLEAGDGDCHYPIINDAISTVKEKP